MVRRLSSADHGEILTLQRASFVDEARLYGTPFVPALEDTIEDVAHRLNASTSWVVVSRERIIGAVSLRTYRNDIPDIERLMVAPDRRGEGLARALLETAERHAIGSGATVLQLIVGDLATANRSMYRHLGWIETSSEYLHGYDDVLLHTMTKTL